MRQKNAHSLHSRTREDCRLKRDYLSYQVKYIFDFSGTLIVKAIYSISLHALLAGGIG